MTANQAIAEAVAHEPEHVIVLSSGPQSYRVDTSDIEIEKAIYLHRMLGLMLDDMLRAGLEKTKKEEDSK